MEVDESTSNQKQRFQKFFFSITIILSMLISGFTGYVAGHIAIDKNSGSNLPEVNAMPKQVNEARNNSLKVVETEISKIMNDLEKYNESINLLVENVKWLEENIISIRDEVSTFNTAITVVTGVGSVVPGVGSVGKGMISNISNSLEVAQVQLDEIDQILLDLEKLTVMKREMNNSYNKLDGLFKEYQKEKNVELLFQIEQELNSNLIYQIEDLKSITLETNKAFELSSTIFNTVNKVKSAYNSMKEVGESTLETIQFWNENKVHAESKGKDLEKELQSSKKEMKELPNELYQRSKNSLISINNVQKELQIIKITQMMMNE